LRNQKCDFFLFWERISCCTEIVFRSKNFCFRTIFCGLTKKWYKLHSKDCDSCFAHSISKSAHCLKIKATTSINAPNKAVFVNIVFNTLKNIKGNMRWRTDEYYLRAWYYISWFIRNSLDLSNHISFILPNTIIRFCYNFIFEFWRSSAQYIDFNIRAVITYASNWSMS